ncbi:MAG: NAD-dependent epimerase/dehydratase family protein [Chloroflexota bacterium]|nr:MAG: epimerase [Chloroflexota bacterium]
MKTLITGGAGFVGSRLAARLLDAGDTVIILDNFNDYYDPALKRANIEALWQHASDARLHVVEGDIRDEQLVRDLFASHGITRVAHLAAMAGVRSSAEQGRLYADVNTSGTVTLLDEARKHDVSVFVLGSTSSVYGATKRIPFVEDDTADRPLAPYPASKRAAEVFGYSYHQLYGLPVTVLRFFNVYGPHGRPDMMPIRAIEAILGDQEITMFEGGTLQRDWTYIDDIVAGVVAALERPMGYQIINLGFGSPVPLTEFIRIYEELIGKRARVRTVPRPLTEPPITYCDNTRARQLLDFAPQVNITEGLARTWAWYRDFHGL